MPQNTNSPLPADKGHWRAQAKATRAKLFAQPGLFATLCQRLQENLVRSPLWEESAHILLYASMEDEVDTHLLLHTAWQQGKHVYLPRCEPGKRGEMAMLACTCMAELVPSRMGILEPAPDAPCFVESRAALAIVPGLVFDRHGYRIGYGGGYYDRLLARCPMRSVGLVFQQNIVPQLPRDPWDMPVAALCSEEEFSWILPSSD